MMYLWYVVSDLVVWTFHPVELFVYVVPQIWDKFRLGGMHSVNIQLKLDHFEAILGETLDTTLTKCCCISQENWLFFSFVYWEHILTVGLLSSKPELLTRHTFWCQVTTWIGSYNHANWELWRSTLRQELLREELGEWWFKWTLPLGRPYKWEVFKDELKQFRAVEGFSRTAKLISFSSSHILCRSSHLWQGNI